MDRLAAAATMAEEIISSVRIAQAYGSEAKLSKLYDDNLAEAEKMGYRQMFAVAIMIASMYCAIYAEFGLAFCMTRIRTF